MSRTTIDIDDTILAELKARAKQQHKTVGQLVTEMTARALHEPPEDPPPFVWYSQDLHPLVDLEDKEAVWRILDER